MIDIAESPASETTMNQAKHVWSACLSKLSERVNSQSYKAWLEPIVPMSLEAGVLTLQVPSHFFYEWIEEHYEEMITAVVGAVLGKDARVAYEIAKDDPPIESHADVAAVAPLPRSEPKSYPPQPESFRIGNAPPNHKRSGGSGSFQNFLNPRYTFENFIKGESNQFACAAATAVANNPGGTAFNPLVIYGGTGLGKTHLLQAIGNRVLQLHHNKRVIYVSSEKFTVEFVEAIQSDRINDFSAFYRSMDILIVDDIQFFAGKEKTQDSFFHTFNELHHLSKQVILSSDRPPKELNGLDDRLLSRFQWGLTADIQPPDLETRIAILQHKGKEQKIDLPVDVVECLAANINNNIRELEGCLISLLARASIQRREITVELAHEVLRHTIGQVKSPITIDEIQRNVCEYFSLPTDLLSAKTRKQEIVNARQIAMYLAKELTNSSLKTIGLHFGGRDHSTVIHAYQCVEDLMRVDMKYRSTVEQIRRRLETRTKV
ncbi:MAG: chromosomal replication initiator protein DnaA [Ignavibacteria bacterium]